MVVDTRVYFSNVSYASSEDDLREYLKNFNVNSVLIPSQTVRRFHRFQSRSFGIAYADFVSAEDAKRVIQECNGKEFKGRVLRVKPFNPYKPPMPIRERVESTLQQIRKFTGYDEFLQSNNNNNNNAATDQPITITAADGTAEENVDSTSPVPAENGEINPIPEENGQDLQSSPAVIQQQSPENQTRDKTLSTDTIYCAFLPKGTTDPELREYFIEYRPREIWIFRTKSINSGPFKLRSSNHTAALVTVTSGTPLEEVVATLQNKKFLNKKITLRPAYLSKIDEVKLVADKSRIISVENGNAAVADDNAAAGDSDVAVEESNIAVEDPHDDEEPLPQEEGETENQEANALPTVPLPIVDPATEVPVTIQPVTDIPVSTPQNQPNKAKKNKNKKKKKQPSV